MLKIENLFSCSIRRLHFSAVLVLAILLIPAAGISTHTGPANDFAEWLAGMKKDALDAGISPDTIRSTLDGLSCIPQVVSLDRRQPETRLNFPDYLKNVVSRERIDRGRSLFKSQKPLLDEIFEQYGVEPRFLVSLWGIESDYGRRSGSFPVIGALATLAYDGRRSFFFRRELLNALRIIDQGHIDAAGMSGSWAGATGQFQFMPSSFLSYAVDHDRNGCMDIWNDQGDALASAANYLKKAGWSSGRPWGMEINLPEGFDRSLIGLRTKKKMTEWSTLGIRLSDGGSLPASGDAAASVIQPHGSERYFLVHGNFRVFLQWNRSTFFALAVGLLADLIAAE